MKVKRTYAECSMWVRISVHSKIVDLWDILLSLLINPLKTKRRPLYLKNQSVPRSKHF